VSDRPVVLLVEDDQGLRELYRLALMVANFTVHTCEDGLEALRYLDIERPDAVVLDLNLPRVSGIALYDELRGHIHTSTVPIIVVTGVTPDPHLQEVTTLIKPVVPDDLVRMVEHALRRRQRTWLFARGTTSVWMQLSAEHGGTPRLVVYGPGRATSVYEGEFGDAMRRQASLVRTLLQDGYESLTTERRARPSPSVRHHPERRQHAP